MTTKVTVELEIEGDPAQAFGVVDAVLESGVFQDAINEFEDDVPNVRVVSAMAVSARATRKMEEPMGPPSGRTDAVTGA